MNAPWHPEWAVYDPTDEVEATDTEIRSTVGAFLTGAATVLVGSSVVAMLIVAWLA